MVYSEQGVQVKVILTLCLVLLMIVPAIAGVEIQLKSGATLKWKSFWEEGENYCTWNDLGKFCISRNTVASISGESEGYTPPSPEEVLERKKREHEENIKEKIANDLKKRSEFERAKKEFPREKLSECLTNANNRYLQAWNYKCSQLGLHPNCGLPTSDAQFLDNRLSNDKAECYQIYNVIKKEIERE